MGSDESNHILFMCFMKSMYYLTFLSNKQKIDIFIKKSPHKVPYLPLNLHLHQNYPCLTNTFVNMDQF